MNTADISPTLTTLFSELVNGAPKDGAYILNADDEGLLRSLDKLSAEAASALTPTGSSIAAHVDHLRYGLSLMNRWSAGENPFGTADWSTSWKKTTVSDEEWRTRRGELRAETSRWLVALRSPRDFLVGPPALLRDSDRLQRVGFTVRDGNYLSARWPGDAHRFAHELADMLG